MNIDFFFFNPQNVSKLNPAAHKKMIKSKSTYPLDIRLT